MRIRREDPARGARWGASGFPGGRADGGGGDGIVFEIGASGQSGGGQTGPGAVGEAVQAAAGLGSASR